MREERSWSGRGREEWEGWVGSRRERERWEGIEVRVDRLGKCGGVIEQEIAN